VEREKQAPFGNDNPKNNDKSNGRSFYLAALCAASLVCSLNAQTGVWEPSAGHVQVAIWPGVVPDARAVTGAETVKVDDKDLVAGKPWVYINNVSRPTMTVYLPTGKNTGAAVVVFPGGGYQILAIDLEGTEVCDWLTAKGITCVLLKYRVPGEGKLPKSGAYPESKEALEDAQRTVGLVRFHAAEWGIDPHKIGVLGFSAGGHLAAAVSLHFDKRLYARVDAADEVSCRPDFVVAIYPGHLWEEGKGSGIEMRQDIRTHITARTPPTFLLQNEDDLVDGVEQSLAYYVGLKKAGVPVEMHLYAQGGHAFGLRRTKLPVTDWPELVERWLGTIGVVAE
jgi:acetyl esterase/lipase